MSSPSFLFANENNHTLLHALLEALNAMIEHQYSRMGLIHRSSKTCTYNITENPNLVYAIVRSHKKFQALRDFTLESGQKELERQNQARKEGGEELSRTNSIDSLRSPTVARNPTLREVPEEDTAFAIGDDDDEDDDDDDDDNSDANEQRPSDRVQSPTQPAPGASRSASVASSVDESVPLQLRGMSEKARGKMPVGQPAFSRQNSFTSLHSAAGPALATNELFTPSVYWVSGLLPDKVYH